MDEFTSQVVSRLVLADAVLSLLSYATESDFLQQIFEEHRGQCYESAVTFPGLVHVISDALLEHEGSARKAMLRAEERGESEASREAVYAKLRRIPISLSNAFLACPSDRLREVFPEGAETPLPNSLGDFDVIALDGKKLKRAAKRLKGRSRKYARRLRADANAPD